MQSLVAREGVINVLRALQPMRQGMLATASGAVNKKLGEFAGVASLAIFGGHLV